MQSDLPKCTRCVDVQKQCITIDVAASAIVFIPVVGEGWGVIWFSGNMISYGITGKGLSENIGESIDNADPLGMGQNFIPSTEYQKQY